MEPPLAILVVCTNQFGFQRDVDASVMIDVPCRKISMWEHMPTTSWQDYAPYYVDDRRSRGTNEMYFVLRSTKYLLTGP
jgi:hypothetical protein